MQIRFFLVSLLFGFNSFFGLNFNLFAETEKKNITNLSKFNIGTEYLEKLPINDYVVGPGDTIEIIVSRDYPELNSKVIIDGEGTIFLPKLNRVYVAGLSLNELKNILNKAFKKFVKFPELELLITNYRPIRVMVQGEVENPGLQTLEGAVKLGNSINQVSDLDPTVTNTLSNNVQNFSVTSFYFPTVFDVIRKSGGITEYSDLSNVMVIRENNLSSGGGEIFTELNFADVIINGDASQNIRVYDSDTIVVNKTNSPNNQIIRKAIISNLNPKFINVFITGRVNSPGDKKVSKASVLSDAIDLAGGTKAMKGPVTFIRFNNDGTIDKRKFAYRKQAKRNSYKNPLLKNGDFIFVGESLLTTTNEIITEITSPITGLFSTYGLYKAITD